MKTDKIDSKAIFEAIMQAAKTGEDVIPDGWKSRSQWQKEWKCGKTKAKDVLNAGVESGILEVRTFKVQPPVGTIQHVPHYRPISKARKKG